VNLASFLWLLCVPVDQRQPIACRRRPDETIFPDREVIPQQSRSTVGLDQTVGFDHAGPHPQRDLSPIPQGRHSRHGKVGGKAMTDIAAAPEIVMHIVDYIKEHPKVLKGVGRI
jgi:hypothetical protein